MHNNYFKKNGKIYIIAGKLKKRKISFNSTPYLRPTTNRTREILFAWLSKYIKNARCLDCFSGSGALGIEAISRNASFVTFLEIEKKTILKIKDNIKKLNIYNLEIIHTDTLKWLIKIKKPYDVIFIDPPYNQNLINKTLNLLNNKKWLNDRAFIYIEKEKKKCLIIPKNWILYKKKITSQIEFCLYVFEKKQF